MLITQFGDEEREAQRPTPSPEEFECFSSRCDEVSPVTLIFELLPPLTNLSSSPESCSGQGPEKSIEVCSEPSTGVLTNRRALRLLPAVTCPTPRAAILQPLSQPLLPSESWGGRAARDRYLWARIPLLLAGDELCPPSGQPGAGSKPLPRPQPSFFLAFHSLSS